MTYIDIKLFKDIAKGMALLLLVVLACGRTMGAGAVLAVGATFLCAMSGRLGWAVIGYILFPFLTVMNPLIVAKGGLTGTVLRVGPMLVTIALLVSGASRSGHHQIPIGMIWFYLFIAAVCSIGGYYPSISYLKIVNCGILFAGLQLGFRNIDKRPQDVMTMRKFLIVTTSFVIWGSIALLIFFPSAAYLTSFRSVLAGESMAAAEAALRESAGIKLFVGVTNQSQCMAIVLPSSIAWLVCDMFFIEKRLSAYHVATILAGIPLIYMTRSRISLLAFVVATILIYFYCLGKINIRPRLRMKLRTAMTGALILVAVAAGVMEVRNQAITKWIRKTEEVSKDTRTVGEAFTASRMGLVDGLMADFKRSPLFGSGFQVTREMRQVFKHHKGMILSAPIEKGVLPLMVLAETGIIGAAFFLVYVIAFYTTCVRKRYYCCATLHTIFLTTNMAEATYFSPSGAGGYLWVLTVGGGFIIDTIIIYRRRLERIARQQQLEMMQMGQRGGV